MPHSSSNYTQGYSKATISSHAQRTVESDAAFLLPHIQPTASILDVGCGPGSITLGFGPLVPQGSVVGVDLSEEVLQQARETLGGEGRYDNVTFQQGDLLAGLPFDDGSFDVVFSSQVFPHLATPQMRHTAAAEMRRILKPGGVLATRDAAELNFYPRHHQLNQLWGENAIKALRNGLEGQHFPGSGMPALFLEVGFEAENMKVGAGTTVHSGKETRRWFVDMNLGRLADGDAFRKSWENVGVTEEDFKRIREQLEAWAEDDAAWYVALQAEVLAWK